MILGVLGGSGLYDIDGLADARSAEVSTPFGAPSGPLVSGRMGEARLLFLPRHGAGHRFSPSEINYRANVFALKAAGATQVLSVSAVGSLREGMPPGDLVLVDQFIDKTFRRASTFFGDGVVGHVSFAEPTCAALQRGGRGGGGRDRRRRGAGRGAPDRRSRAGAGKRLHRGGTYVCMEGPQFSTRAESLLAPQLGRGSHRHDGGDGGQALPRGRALLRVAGAGHRLRLLARRGGGGHRRGGRRGPDAPTSPAPRRSCAACRRTPRSPRTAVAPGPPLTPFSPRRRRSRPRRANACGHFTGERSEHVVLCIASFGRGIGRPRHGRDARGKAHRRAGRRRLVLLGRGVVPGAGAADRRRRHRLPRRRTRSSSARTRSIWRASSASPARPSAGRASTRRTSRRAPRSTRSSTSSRTFAPSCRRPGPTRRMSSWRTSIRCCS